MRSLGELTIVSAEGTESGYTAITVTPDKAEGQLYKYKVADAETPVVAGQNVRSWTAWDGEEEIEAESGKVITIVECGVNYLADKAGHATVVAKA